MNTADHNRNRRRRASQPTVSLEALETRALMTAGAGNTFAIIPGVVQGVGSTTPIAFSVSEPTITPTTRGKITIGIDVAAQTSSSVVPKIVGVEDMATGKMLPITHSVYDKAVKRTNPNEGPYTTAVLTTLKLPVLPAGTSTTPHNYQVLVQGLGGTVGNFLAGFYLPGDANAAGTVDTTSITAIRKAMGANANSSKYSFPADANRDGQVNAADLKLAEQNLGAKVTVTPVVAANLNPSSDSGLQDRVTNIRTVNFNGTSTPGASISYQEINDKTPVVATTATVNGTYSLMIPLADGSNTFQVTAKDSFGQTISGQISPVTYSVNAAPSVGS